MFDLSFTGEQLLARRSQLLVRAEQALMLREDQCLVPQVCAPAFRGANLGDSSLCFRIGS